NRIVVFRGQHHRAILGSITLERSTHGDHRGGGVRELDHRPTFANGCPGKTYEPGHIIGRVTLKGVVIGRTAHVHIVNDQPPFRSAGSGQFHPSGIWFGRLEPSETIQRYERPHFSRRVVQRRPAGSGEESAQELGEGHFLHQEL